MANSYISVASQKLTAAANVVTFSSIPTVVGTTTIKDLIVVVHSGSTSAGGDAVKMSFNGDTAANYNTRIIESSGSSLQNGVWNTTGIANSYNTIMFSGSTYYATCTFHINNFASTAMVKTVVGRSGRGEKAISLFVGDWNSTAAITSISFKMGDPAANFSAGSTFALYGIES